MHEATLVAGILRMAQEEAKKHAVSRITAVRLEVGLLACVEPQTLRGCFEIFAEGSMAEGAKLEVVVAPLACVCQDCAQEFALRKKHFICPHCGSTEISFEGGNGCIISAIEVAT